ncbi:DUF2846 domain-containing protein [Steroidobacter cummioxidans]|uniref:DUF2846 domain-containing protein n=1 Tax=Steroidobacter cummioxidans TaxID=1803913 RepID=UPI000E30DF06|nr:DUF2846 domain-containing protein [Steroidobacter cummioxidans]
MRNLALIVLSVLTSACGTAKGPPFSPAQPPGDDQALIYIYAPPSDVPALASFGYDCGLALDNQQIGRLQPHGYTHIYLQPGRHDVDSWLGAYTYPPLRITDRFEAGQTYYYRFEVTGNPRMLQWAIRQVSSQQARREIVEYRHQPNTYKQ